MKPLLKTVLPVLASLTVLTLVGCGGDQSISVGGAATIIEEPAPSSGTLSSETIIEVVQDVSSNFGEESPEQVSWVEVADRNSPARLIRGEGAVVSMDGENVPVVVVSARGQFNLPSRSGLDDSEATNESRIRSALYFTIDQATGDVLDVDITDVQVDIAELGEVHHV